MTAELRPQTMSLSLTGLSCASCVGRAERALERMGVRSVRMSGDTPIAAGVVGRGLGIADVHGGVTPEAKLSLIKGWQMPRLSVTALTMPLRLRRRAWGWQ